MRHIIKLLLVNLTLLSSFFVNNPEPSLKAYAATVAIPESTTIANDILTMTESKFENLPEATPETFVTSEIDSNSYEYLNYNTIGGTAFLHASEDNIYDLMNTIAYSSGLEDKLVEKNNVSYLKTTIVDQPYTGSGDYYTYYYAYYKTVKTNIWFVDKEDEDNQRISFYTAILDKTEAYLNEMNDYLNVQFTLPVITINNEYTLLSIQFNGKGKSFKLITHNYASIKRTKISSVAMHASYSSPYLISMPFIENITDIKLLDIGGVLAKDSNSISSSYDDSVRFQFDQSMKGLYRAYPFDITSLSISDGYIAVNNNYSLVYKDYDSADNTVAKLISMKATYTHTVKTTAKKDVKVGDLFPTLTGLAASKYADLTVKVIDGSTIISKEITENLEITFKDKKDNGDITYWYFKDQIDVDEYSSGTLKILSVTWKLNDSDGDELSFNATNHYEDVNVHKYSFNASKAIRTFNYKMSGYMRGWSSKDANWLIYLGGLITIPYGIYKEVIIDYQCYGFSFYFDKSMTMPINNIKKVVVKYQCGYEKPNSDNDGWYPNGEDPSKRVVVRTMELAKDRFLLGCALDDYGMVLTNSANKVMATDDYGNKFDYVIYKQHKVSDINTYVTKMNPLEINYETKEKELVRMVGNSLGLHVCLDDDGEYRVYDADGNLAQDYAPGIGDDGSYFVGKDENGDGVISTDEAVDSDLGTVLQEMDPYEEPWWANDGVKTGLTIGIVILAIVLIIVIYAILKPQDFAFICKTIANSFRSKRKNRKARKKKKTKKKKKGKS